MQHLMEDRVASDNFASAPDSRTGTDLPRIQAHHKLGTFEWPMELPFCPTNQPNVSLVMHRHK